MDCWCRMMGLWWSAGLLLSGFSCRQGLTAETSTAASASTAKRKFATQRMCIFFFFVLVRKRISGARLVVWLCWLWHCWLGVAE